jgi:hypothetical protein
VEHVSWIVRIVGALVLLAVLGIVLGVAAYASDYSVQGTVTEKKCGFMPPTVTIHTKQLGITKPVEVSTDQCGILSPGNFVVYRIRSGRTTIYEREGGGCLYDTDTGIRCGGPSGLGL